MHGRPSVIQGYFPQGLARITPPAPAQARPAGPATVQQRPAPGHRPAVAQPQAAAVRPSPNGFAMPLPSHVAMFSNSGGQPLPPVVLRKMEASFGADFSDVRIHVGPHASVLGALAFTHGSNIHFAPGQYNPTTPQGQQLLGHELAHVVQQRAGRVSNPFGTGIAVVQNAMLEAEADRLGLRAASQPAPVPSRPHIPAVQRKAVAQPQRAGARITAPVQRPMRPPSAGVLQRAVDTTNASAGLRDAWGIFLRALGRANAPQTQALVQAARHDDRIDLCLRSSGMFSRVGLLSWFTTHGLTTWWDDYGGNPEHMTTAMANQMRDGRAWREDRKPTIEVIVTKHFWEGVGSLLGTLAHEMVIHSARYGEIAREIRGQRIDNGMVDSWFNRNLLVRGGADTHHDSLRIGNVDDQYRTELRNIVNKAVEVLREDRRESVARALISHYFGDLWEHTSGPTAFMMGLFGVTLSDDI